MRIVVVESPFKPQASSVEKLRALISTCESHDLYVESLTADEKPHMWGESWGVTVENDVRLRNVYYARAAMLDCLRRDEAPFLSHLLYTQVLDDDVPEERALGIEASAEVSRQLLETGASGDHVFYTELGFSDGMLRAAWELNTIGGTFAEVESIARTAGRKLGDEARAWYLARVPEILAWL